MVERLVDHFTKDEPERVWDAVHGKPEFGRPATMNEESFTAFLASPQGRDWICGINGLCASYYAGVLNHCETERAKAMAGTRQPLAQLSRSTGAI